MSTPLFDPDDPRLTAYALGEVTADERQAVEQLLAASPEARAAVEQTRVLARLLEEDYARENAAYQRANPQPVVPANVIPFPTVQRRRWPPAVAWAWKAAAVFVAVASMVWLVGRRPPPAPVASVQPIGRTATASRTQEAVPAPPAAPEPSAHNDEFLAAAPAPEAQPEVAKHDAPLPLAEATPDAAPMLAEATGKPGGTDEFRVAPADQDAPGGAPMLADRAAQALPAAEAPLLAAARPVPAPAAPRSAPTVPTKDPLTAVVRLREPDGTYVGGVLLTSDGWILAAPATAATNKLTRRTVVLANRRQFFVVPSGTNNPPGLLRIDASSLPSIRLATDAPDNGSTLLAVHVDPRTGEASLTRGRAKQAGGRIYLDGAANGADFVFNDAAELLATEQAAPATAKSAARAQAAVRREVSVPPVSVRPFTMAERAALTRSPQ